jgi:hypothetical protein
MRIMTNSYIKSIEFDKKYKNRDSQDIMGDDEYQKFKEEEKNTKKMTTILRKLNSPRRKTSTDGFFHPKEDKESISKTQRNISSSFNGQMMRE